MPSESPSVSDMPTSMSSKSHSYQLDRQASPQLLQVCPRAPHHSLLRAHHMMEFVSTQFVRGLDLILYLLILTCTRLTNIFFFLFPTSNTKMSMMKSLQESAPPAAKERNPLPAESANPPPAESSNPPPDKSARRPSFRDSPVRAPVSLECPQASRPSLPNFLASQHHSLLRAHRRLLSLRY